MIKNIRAKGCVLMTALAAAYGIYLICGAGKIVETSSRGVIESEVAESMTYGQLYLHLEGACEENAPSLLINGKSIGTVTSENKTLDIFDMCVVELDTRGLETPVMLTITGKGTNVAADCIGRVVTGCGNIENIGTFVVDKQGV